MAKITVKDTEVSVIKVQNEDYISLTDMLKAKEGEFFFSNWLRNRNTIEFLGIWEKLNNPDFNYVEFDIIKTVAGLNNFRLSAKEWMERTNAIGIVSRAGRYGGTVDQLRYMYASEADILNVALFGMTASEWRNANPEMSGNIRDQASINELICLSNMESMNSVMINEGLSQSDRLSRLNEMAIFQMEILTNNHNRNILK